MHAQYDLVSRCGTVSDGTGAAGLCVGLDENDVRTVLTPSNILGHYV